MASPVAAGIEQLRLEDCSDGLRLADDREASQSVNDDGPDE